MEENLTLIGSPSGSLSEIVNEDYINWTSVPFPIDFRRNDVDNNEEIVRMIQIIVRPPIIILGTIGNLLTFFTMRRGSLKEQSTCFYMTILALADTGEVCFIDFDNLSLSLMEFYA